MKSTKPEFAPTREQATKALGPRDEGPTALTAANLEAKISNLEVAHRHERYFFCLVLIILTAVDLDTLEGSHFIGQFMVWALALILPRTDMALLQCPKPRD